MKYTITTHILFIFVFYFLISSTLLDKQKQPSCPQNRTKIKTDNLSVN